MKALTYINLPGVGKFAPGAKITKTQLREANQTEEDIQALVEGGSLGNDDDPLHSDHAPVQVVYGRTTHDLNPVSGDFGVGSDV